MLDLTNQPISTAPAIGPDGTIYVGSEHGWLFCVRGHRHEMLTPSGASRLPIRVQDLSTVHRPLERTTPFISSPRTRIFTPSKTINQRHPEVGGSDDWRGWIVSTSSVFSSSRSDGLFMLDQATSFTPSRTREPPSPINGSFRRAIRSFRPRRLEVMATFTLGRLTASSTPSAAMAFQIGFSCQRLHRLLSRRCKDGTVYIGFHDGHLYAVRDGITIGPWRRG